MIDIKPIETKYKGYLFRSRAEARWAMFFDLMKIPYAYEPEGLLLPNGIRYLPDFYLPDCDTWFEVKGVMDDTSIQKISALLKYGNKPVIVGYPDMTFEACDIWIDEGGMKYFARAYKCESMLCKCRKCGKYYFTGMAGSWECLCCGTHEGDRHFSILTGGDLSDVSKYRGVEYAFNKAKQARFE